MKTLTVASLLSLVTAFARPVFAQPYPSAPAPQPLAPLAVDASEAGAISTEPTTERPYDPNIDSDPDIDGYDAEYDVHYDNLAAQGYDDGYDPNAYAQFEGALQPYGNWVDDPSYGHVWSPSVSTVGSGFFPYASNGRWVLSEYGWTWVSDYDWGWAPFHYGRWVTSSSLGWCWVPGSIWGPAWVSWRSGNGYVGWTPLPPRGQPIPAPAARGGGDAWRFTLAHQLGSRQPSYLPRQVVPSVFSRTSVVTNLHSVAVGSATVHVNAGPTSITGATAGPIHLRVTAPQELPRLSIVPHPGVGLPQRPWVRAAATGVSVSGRRAISLPSQSGYRSSASIPIGPQSGVYRPAPVTNGNLAPHPSVQLSPRPYVPHNGSLYVAPPSYARQPTPSTFYAPRQAQPSYQAPAQHYAQPVYSPPTRQNFAPQPSYQAPVQHVQPVYSAPVHQTYVPPQPSYQAPVVAPAATVRPSFGHPVATPQAGRRR